MKFILISLCAVVLVLHLTQASKSKSSGKSKHKTCACPASTAPQNGAISSSQTIPYTKVQYRCDYGYILTVSKSCTRKGSWAWEEPTCSIVTCPALTPPENGHISPEDQTVMKFEDVVVYSCILGYKPIGNHGNVERNCMASGQWSGTDITCENSDACSSTPCQNGGTCTNEVNNYSCMCVAGYTGTNCETDVNECLSSPCQNEGTCTDEVNKYSCLCQVGYIGTNCEEDSDACSSTPCQNGGTCTNEVNNYSCMCVAGYTGTNCETDVNECLSSPCQNEGTCTDEVNKYSCLCQVGYIGTNCEEVDDCATKPCNFGWCTDGDNTYTCQCYPGFTGENCDREIDNCDPNPCQNGGLCTTGGDGGYSCFCDLDSTGSNCETLVPFP